VPPPAPGAGLRIMAAYPSVPFRFLVEQQARRKVVLGILALAEILLIGRMRRRETSRTGLAALLLGGAAARRPQRARAGGPPAWRRGGRARLHLDVRSARRAPGRADGRVRGAGTPVRSPLHPDRGL